MLGDSLWNFCGASPGQAITASAASTNYVDTGVRSIPPGGHTATPVSDLGKGTRIPILIQVTETFATLTSLTVGVQVDDNTGFSSAATVLSSPAIPVASLVAGYQFVIDMIPPKTNERYMQLYFTVAGSNATAGKIFATVVEAKQDWFF